jgi:NAD(P)-dependent dehydrogenase (short-subunit alcohol dehydrogenase family)
MDLNLRGRRALVTGASKGIGLAIGKALAAEGCHVHLRRARKRTSTAPPPTSGANTASMLSAMPATSATAPTSRRSPPPAARSTYW